MTNCPNCGMPFVPPPHGRPFDQWECGTVDGHGDNGYTRQTNVCRTIDTLRKRVEELEKSIREFCGHLELCSSRYEGQCDCDSHTELDKALSGAGGEE